MQLEREFVGHPSESQIVECNFNCTTLNHPLLMFNDLVHNLFKTAMMYSVSSASSNPLAHNFQLFRTSVPVPETTENLSGYST